ncbi:MAG: multiple resistance and pH regulation protein F [Lysobacterales bacterium]|nr:MAG: multiple resistance and pH regulation protein F [Xanthomonadales bacterium]
MTRKPRASCCADSNGSSNGFSRPAWRTKAMLASEYFVPLLIVGLLLCCGFCLYRIANGPTAADRMVAIDILGTVVVGFVAIIAALSGKAYLLDVALVWALVAFIGTLALAKYLLGKELDE